MTTPIIELSVEVLESTQSTPVTVEIAESHFAVQVVESTLPDPIVIEAAEVAQAPGPIGPVGPIGVPGPPGPTGPAGGAGGSYVHTQNSASAHWIIPHNLGYYPNVTVVDSAGTEVEGVVNYVSTTTITVDFAAAFGGTAYLS